MKITLWSVIALRSKVEQVLMSCGSFSARQGAPEKRTVKWEVDSTAPLRARTLTLDLADCTCSRARSTRQHSWRLEQGASNSEAERGTHTHTRGCGACRSPSKCSTFGGGGGGPTCHVRRDMRGSFLLHNCTQSLPSWLLVELPEQTSRRCVSCGGQVWRGVLACWMWRHGGALKTASLDDYLVDCSR